MEAAEEQSVLRQKEDSVFCVQDLRSSSEYFEMDPDFDFEMDSPYTVYSNVELDLTPLENLEIDFNLSPMSNFRQERFIIGVDKPYEKDGLEAVLEAMLGEDFFERNKFRLFLGVVIILVCLLVSCFCCLLRKTCGKCGHSNEERRFQQISVSDKIVHLESGLQQETFQFMPLKALSPHDISISYQDEADLPDYEQLQMKKIDPNKL